MLLVPAARANPAKHQEAFIIKKKNTQNTLKQTLAKLPRDRVFFFFNSV